VCLAAQAGKKQNEPRRSRGREQQPVCRQAGVFEVNVLNAIGYYHGSPADVTEVTDDCCLGM
jgi:hypothetical protein